MVWLGYGLGGEGRERFTEERRKKRSNRVSLSLKGKKQGPAMLRQLIAHLHQLLHTTPSSTSTSPSSSPFILQPSLHHHHPRSPPLSLSLRSISPTPICPLLFPFFFFFSLYFIFIFLYFCEV